MSPVPNERRRAVLRRGAGCRVEFLVLGPLEVFDAERRVPLGSAKQRLLLAALLVHANELVSADRLTDILWGDDQPADAVGALQTYVSRLRGALEARRPTSDPAVRLLTRAPGYLLQTGEEQVDAARFEGLLGEGQQRASAGDPAVAAAILNEALTLWRGHAFAEFADDDFARPEAARLEELRRVALDERAEANLTLGRHAELIGELEGIVASDPLRERSRGQLMLALYRSGRQGEALRAFQEYRRYLSEELGIEPSPAMRELEGAILLQKSELDWTPGPERSDVEPELVSVTFLFTDLEDSTPLWEEHPGQMRAALARHDAILREAVTSAGGDIVKTTGDGIHATFTRTLDAVTATHRAQECLAAEDWGQVGRLAVRMGIHVGEAQQRDGDYFGPVLNRASRLMAAAHGGQVVLSQAAAEAVRDTLPDGVGLLDLGEHRLRGLARPERIFQLTVTGLRVDYPPLTSLDAFPGHVPLPAPAFARCDEDFAGRAAALEQLQTAWRHARAGIRQIALVAGEPGIGKTRLAAELSERAYREGHIVLYGRCDEETVTPYQPVIEALHPYLAALAPSVLQERLHDLAGDLVRVFPELLGRIPELTRPSASASETTVGGLEDSRAADRYRLFEAITALLTGIAATQPVLLVLDDLHWADQPTVLLLRHMLRAVTHAPLLVVGCYRDVELPRGHAAADLMADLRQEPSVTWISLNGLSESEAEALLRGVAGRPVAAPLVAALQRETGGNPFFLEELLRHLREVDAIPLLEAGLSDTVELSDLDLPDTVRDVVLRRLRRLPSSVNDALSIAAIIGQVFEAPLLARAAEQPVTDILDALDQAVDTGLVTEDASRVGRYAFSHALIRQALYSDLGTSRRMRLHRQVGIAMEEEGTGRRSAAALAQHFLPAAALGEATRAIQYTAAAGREAAANLAFEDAVTYFERALELLEEHAPGDSAGQAELLVDLADSLVYVDEEAGVEAAVRAVDAARSHGSPVQFGRAVAVFAEPAHSSAAYPGEVAALFDEAMAVLGNDHAALRARLLAILAFKYTTYQLRGRDGRSLAHEALEVARVTGDPLTLAEALLARAASLEGLPDLTERRALSQELAALGRVAGARPRSHGLGVLAVVQLASGDADGLAATTAELARVGDELRWLPAHVHAARWRATQALLEGRFDEVRAAGKEMQRFARGYRGASGMLGAVLFYLAREQGELRIPTADQPLKMQRENLHAMVMTALAQVDAGRVTSALEELSFHAADGTAAAASEPAWPALLGVLSEAAAGANDATHAEFLVEQLSPFSGLLLTFPTGLAALGAADRHLGMLATLLGQWDEAADCFERSLALEERARGFALLPRTRYWQGRFLRARGQAGDEAAAAAVQREVRDTTSRLGMTRLHAAAAKLSSA